LDSVAIYNLNGQKIKMGTEFQKQNSTIQFDVSDLNNGIYFIKVTSKELTKTMKLFIQK